MLNSSTKKCQCPPGSFNDTNLSSCVKCMPPRIWVSKSNKCVCPPSLKYNIYGECWPCPLSTPKWNGFGCVPCPSGHTFNIGCGCCCKTVPGVVYNKSTLGCALF